MYRLTAAYFGIRVGGGTTTVRTNSTLYSPQSALQALFWLHSEVDAWLASARQLQEITVERAAQQR